MTEQMMNAATFAGVFVALYVGHTVGDHWAQTDHQAANKGKKGRHGSAACFRHVLSLTAVQAVALAGVVLLVGLPVSFVGAAAGLLTNALTHYWADRRFTLAWLARVVGQHRFHGLGAGQGHLATGAYAMDQSFHVGWLLVAALVVTVL